MFVNWTHAALVLIVVIVVVTALTSTPLTGLKNIQSRTKDKMGWDVIYK